MDCCVPPLLNPALESSIGSIGSAIHGALEVQPLAPSAPGSKQSKIFLQGIVALLDLQLWAQPWLQVQH